MFQLLFLALLPFVLCQETYIKPEMPVSRYEDMEPLAQNFFKVQELTRTTVYGLWQYRLYQEGDNTYITTSHYDDKETHTGSFPVLKWNEDDEVFENNDVDAFPQVDGTTRIKGTTGTGFNTYATDFLALTYPFQTKDGNWWAYDTVGLVEDNRVRYRGEVSWTGEAYMRLWDTDSESWGSNDSSTGTDTWRVEGSGWRHQYFVGSDDREYVFTYNYGNDTRVPAWAQGVYQCTLLEYGAGSDGAGSSWSVVTYGSGTTDDAFPACPQLPSNPVVFTSVNSEWMYLATSQGSPSCPSGVASCTVNKAVAPATWWTTSNNGRDSYRNFWNVSDRIDAFNIPACVEAKHWVYDGFDYIVALTETGVATYRLWWNTHEVEELPFLSIGQPDLRFMDFFTVGHRECILVSSSYLNTYPTTPVPGSEDSWTNIYCWDPTHDNWDFAGAIPSEGTLWATHFTHDDRQYIVRVEEGHHQTKNVHVYRIFIEDDEETDIYYDVWNPSNDHIYKRVDRNGDRIHKTLAVSITSLCVLILIFVFVLLMLYVSTSGGGGGGGSTDYRGM